jgi:drug/metabolite transporter (DMT)-like permease
MFRIHFAVLMFGVTGLFGKFVSSPSYSIVFYRCLFAVIFLLVWMKWNKIGFSFNSARDLRLVIVTGLILAGHWLFFFESIKVSTVSIGLISYAMIAVFTTFIEPVYFRSRIRFLDIILAIISFFGILLIVPSFSFSNSITLGVIFGLLAAFLGSVLTVLCRELVARNSSIKISFFEYLVVVLVLCPWAFGHSFSLTVKDFLFLLVLGVVFTGVANPLFIRGLRKVSAAKANIILMLEPFYGIILAVLIFKESLNGKEILGGLIIIACAFIATIDAQMAAKSQTVSKKFFPV